MLFHYAPDTGDVAVLLRHRRQREPDRRLHRHRQGPAAAEGVLRRAGARSPTPATTASRRRKPVGTTSTYFGVDVFEGAYQYTGMRLVPSWGGSMFEALMPALFVPEERWAPRSWGINHPLTVAAQIHHGLVEAGYGYWGFSPSNTPEGGYGAYGVDGVGMDPNGIPVQRGQHAGRPRLRRAARAATRKPDPPPSAYTNGVVTPHAAFLALRYAPGAALADLAPARARLPRHVRQVGLPRQRQRRHRRTCRAPTCRSTRA